MTDIQHRAAIMNMGSLRFLDVEKEMAHAMESAQLEMELQRVKYESEMIYKDEEIRKLRVQLVLQEHGEQALREDFEAAEDQFTQVQEQYDDVRDLLMEADTKVNVLQNELKIRMREAEHYQAEIQALSNASADSAKLLTEKLTMSRELQTLKPELEHLRSQAAANQATLAEKLALQREVNSLQVELETERRALLRVKAKDVKMNEEDSQALSQLEDLRKELAKEKKETQRIERENRKQIAELEGQKTISESKLDAFRNKLRTTKEQLKQAQDELKGTQEQLERAQTAARVSQRPSSTGNDRPINPRKRNVARFDPDLTIGTPGEPHAAKRARISTAPGEKSTFSITPFLNRTTSILADSPNSNADQDNDEVPEAASPLPNVVPTTTAPVPQDEPSKPVKSTGTGPKGKPKPLQEVTGLRVNATTGAARKPMSKLSLPKVSEEDDEETEAVEEATKTSNLEPMKKKKQKVLGGKGKSTLFDDEEVTQPKSRGKTLLGGSKGIGLRGGGLALSSKPRSLAEFSPLKKDRKSA